FGDSLGIKNCRSPWPFSSEASHPDQISEFRQEFDRVTHPPIRSSERLIRCLAAAGVMLSYSTIAQRLSEIS
ncbi:hypothetical protein, partial [Pseudomonas coronafaciens]|uniref:hypothetical protein n=1 Tax=Pseudomonas coronafaciens TaxID=53409 RepID=UPI001C804FD1